MDRTVPVQPEEDDINLIERAREGDGIAYGLLYDRYVISIYRFLYSHLDSPRDAEDLTEDVFLRVWQSLPKYQFQGVPFAAYLFRIARNTLTDHYRKRSKQDHVPFEMEITDPGQPDPLKISIQNQERQQIREVMLELKEDYQNVLVLRFFAGLTPDETAQVLGKSPGSTRVLQHRALAALKKLLSQGR